ncbi:MAG: lipoprotein NlpD [Methylophilaceae bacterium]|jgi:lipoprotein NlpD|tara:strand:+ start:953 stop:1825 length:873 start_codon:yes stop_codon:yes gene_type:complete
MNKIFFVLVSFLLFGCASQFPAPVDGERKKISKKCPDVYTVKKGETIFSISLKCGFNYKKLALSNGLKKPYFVKPGDQIRFDLLRKNKSKVSEDQNKENQTNTIPFEEDKIIEDNTFINDEISQQDSGVEFQFGDPIQINQPKVIREVYSKKSIKKSKKLSALKAKNQKNWQWPTDGELTSSFNNASDKKGIEILGLEGQEIRSVAKGKVIYVGEDLAGYGKLTIIKHDNNVLSVYGHQQSILITEGQTVQAGQSIGTMGNTGADEVKLLFEIRKDGESIDPVKFLKKLS